jgi:transposase
VLVVRCHAYLKATLEAIVKGHPAARIDELMPWNFDKQA